MELLRHHQLLTRSNRGYSSYASLTGVQLTRVVSPVNKRAPSNGKRSQKANLPRRRFLEQVEDPTSGEFEKRHRIHHPRLSLHFSPRHIPEECEKKNEGAHLFTGNTPFPESSGTFWIIRTDGTRRNNREQSVSLEHDPYINYNSRDTSCTTSCTAETLISRRVSPTFSVMRLDMSLTDLIFGENSPS